MLLKVKKEGAEALIFGLVYYYQILEEEMAIHSSFLARRIPWTEEPAG